MSIPGIAQIIIQSETNPVRFENFCRGLYQKAEGMTLVPTSSNYDRGRDAKSIGRSTGTHRGIICCSLDQDPDAKVERDLETVQSTTVPELLVYCSSQGLTEHHSDQIARYIRDRLAPSTSVVVLGSKALADLAERFPAVLEQFYPAEIKAIENSLLSPLKAGETAETRGLRLALVAFCSEDAKTLRRVISQRAVMEILRAPAHLTPADIAQNLSVELGLPKPIIPQFIESVLTALRDDGLVTGKQEGWSLTDRGREELEKYPLEGARELLAGRAVIRTGLEELTGVTLAESHFETVWATLLDSLSHLFYSNGLAVIQAIDRLLSPKGGTPGFGPNLEKLMEDTARRVGQTAAGADLAESLEQAILDIFSERRGAAFDWLSRISERFVALCALGLESTSAEEIRRSVLRNRIVLDSDIVLTLLCEGEPEHETATELLNRYRRLGGRFLLASPVLEEVAYHAWISEKDFRETHSLLGKLSGQDQGRYVANAFVRAFHRLVRDASDGKKWPLYIKQFRGNAPSDFSNLLASLQPQLGADMLPVGYDQDTEARITDSLKASVAGAKRVDPTMLDTDDLIKLERDGKLIASIASVRANLRRAGDTSSVVLLSSSTRLRRIDERFRNVLGEPPAVISLSAFSYLLSLIPDVQLGLNTLRRALFEFGEMAHLSDVNRVALRVIKAQGDYDLPWARRGMLEKQLDSVIMLEAKKRDMRPQALREQFSTGDQAARPAELIITALEQMAISDAKSIELQQAKRKIRDLEETVAALKSRLNTRA